MHSPLTCYSYMEPVISPQVPKMYSEVQNRHLFFISLDITWFIFRVPLKKAA